MWKQYGESAGAVCVQTTVGKLRDCLKSSVEITRVEYFDRGLGKTPFTNVLQPFCYKEKSFEYEREILALIFNDPREERSGVPETVLLEELIETVYVAPSSDSWVVELVKGDPSKVQPRRHQSRPLTTRRAT